jgi:hypothetical protein
MGVVIPWHAHLHVDSLACTLALVFLSRESNKMSTLENPFALGLFACSTRCNLHSCLQVKLAKDCIVNLDAGDIATEVGPMPLALWKWVLMILEILGL